LIEFWGEFCTFSEKDESALVNKEMFAEFESVKDCPVSFRGLFAHYFSLENKVKCGE